jgi:hypothetical protein
LRRYHANEPEEDGDNEAMIADKHKC